MKYFLLSAIREIFLSKLSCSAFQISSNRFQIRSNGRICSFWSRFLLMSNECTPTSKALVSVLDSRLERRLWGMQLASHRKLVEIVKRHRRLRHRRNEFVLPWWRHTFGHWKLDGMSRYLLGRCLLRRFFGQLTLPSILDFGYTNVNYRQVPGFEYQRSMMLLNCVLLSFH